MIMPPTILGPSDPIEHSCILSIELTVCTGRWQEVGSQWLCYVQHNRSPIGHGVCRTGGREGLPKEVHFMPNLSDKWGLPR